MKKISKKALALLLSVVMLCSAFATMPFTASAEEGNLASEATFSANGSETAGFSADKAKDGIVDNYDSRWASPAANAPHWLQASFTEPKAVQAFRIFWERDNLISFEIQSSNDNSSWKPIYTWNKSDNGTNPYTQIINLETPVTARYFRLYISDFSAEGARDGGSRNTWNTVSVMEFELYADELAMPAPSLSSIASSLTMPTITAEDNTFPMPEVSEDIDIEDIDIKINGADYEQIIANDGTIRHPLNDTDVKISFVLSNDEESVTTPDYTVTVPGVAEGTVPENANSKPAVIPELAEWQGGTGDYTLSADPRLILDTASYSNLTEKDQKKIELTAEIVAIDFEEITGKKLTIVTDPTDARPGDITVSFKAADSTQLGDEGYRMEIKDSISIESETVTGFFWATRSILQILKQNGTTIPQGLTYDYPRFAIRGFMLDVGRTPINLETLYNVMKNMAWYKMNDFQVHLYDNNIFLENYVTPEDRAKNDFSKVLTAYSGFRLESDVKNDETGATLTSDDRYYTKDEFRTFIQISRACGVGIVPEFDAPAHSLSIVQVFPEYGLYNSWAGHTSVDHLDLSKPEVTEFIKDLWREYTEGDDPVFDEDTVLHIGADEYNDSKKLYRQFVDEMFRFIQEDLNRTPRVWGSLSNRNDEDGTTPVRVDGVQMNIWSTGWAKPLEMYNLGYKMINILDGGNYIVPAAGYYGDYLNAQSKYNSYEPNNFSGIIVPSGSEQMLGGAYAIWNDMTDTYERGMTDYDIFDRFFKPLIGYASKLWGDAADLTYAQAADVFAVTSTAPNTNPYYEVKSKTDTKVKYDFDDETIKDKAGNGYDVEEVKNAEVVNEQGKNALKLNGGESYVSTPIDFFGADSELSFSVYRENDSKDEQILFETSDRFETWAIKAVQKETGMVGFSREKCDFSFDYELPVGKWVDLKIVGHKDTADLYVDGEFVSTVGTAVTSQAPDLHATLMIPFARIGSETNAFKGLIAGLSVYQQTPFDPNDPTIIDRSNFSISSDNYYAGTTEGPANLAIDGDNSTIWHSNYSPYEPLPASLTIDMKEVYTIDKFTYLPRQDGSANGIITSYTLSYKLNADDEWTEVAAGNLAGDSSAKQIPFEAVEARYVKFTAISGKTNSANQFASAAEVYVHQVLNDYTLGDVTGDGAITSLDATVVLQYAAGIVDKDDPRYIYAAADVSGDDAVTSLDATYILQYAAGLLPDNKFPAEN